MQRATIPLLVTNGTALQEWKQMAWTHPCMVGGREEEEGGVVVKEREKGGHKNKSQLNLVKVAENKERGKFFTA